MVKEGAPLSTIVCGERRASLDHLTERAAKAAEGLKSLGVGRGDRVAIFLRNDIAYVEASLAIGMLGAYSTPVNWHYTAAEAQYLFENSGAKALIIHADLIGPVRKAIPANVHVLVVETPPEVSAAYGIAREICTVQPGMTEWSHWLDAFPPYVRERSEAPGSIIYTSGTTGHPKGVTREPPSPEQAAFLLRVHGRGFGFTSFLETSRKIVVAVCGPMYHAAPNAYCMMAARVGADVVLQPRFDPEGLLALIEQHRVTHMSMVPIMFNRLQRLPEEVKRKYDLSSLSYIVHNAAPCSPAVKRAMLEWWGPIIHESYGSTETNLVAFCTPEEWLSHPGTVGRIIPDAIVRILDADAKELPAGEIGEIAARQTGGPDFTYHGDDGKRRAADRDGLIATGDIGYVDPEGFLYLCDRASHMIISGGVNIYPAEIEAELHKMPGVEDCAVFGIPDEEFGEAVCAIVQPVPGKTLAARDVQSYLRERLAGFKVPKRVEFSDLLPREDSGKIFKRKLRDPFWVGLERRI
jgi:long-chain acyl-CoA synthetase